MIKGASPLVERISQYVFTLFRTALPAEIVYHDFNHTFETAKAARELGKAHQLSEEDMELLLLAAFLHDTGYTQKYNGHEEVSAEIAKEVLTKEQYPSDRIERVVGCIMATRMPQSPGNLLEEILCDSDLNNLAKDSHQEKSTLLRSEWESMGIKEMSDDEWMRFEYDFLAKHQFHTAWAHIHWNAQKYTNILRIRKEIMRMNWRKSELDEKLAIKKQEMSRKERKDVLPDRGIETMFRTASRTHINLSAIADNKANIMLSINALIISVVISGLATKLDSNQPLLIPTIVLLTVCVISIIFATLSTRPSITRGKFTREDIEKRRTNLLFFGNFYNMDLADYEWGMDQMMRDKSFLYGTLTRDLYFLGVVLAKKYKFLRLTYTIFMFGLIVSVLAFAITFLVGVEAAEVVSP